ncbi:mucin-16-like [Rhinoraja longicauda]
MQSRQLCDNGKWMRCGYPINTNSFTNTDTISPIQTTTPNLQTNPFDFNVTFVATNLTSAADLQDPNSALFNSAANVIVLQLNQLFSRSNVNGTFSSCRVLSFSSSAVQGTRVHANCTFRNDSDPQDVNRVRLYRVFRDLSNGITTLGPILLDSNSLYVNAISPIQTTTPNLQTNPFDFNVTFVATNLTSAADLQDPNSALFNSAANIIVLQLNQLFSRSNVNGTFSSCRVLSFSSSAVQGTRVHANCTFRNDSDPQDVNRVRLYRVFRDLSNGITTLGPILLDSNSLYVNAISPIQTTTPNLQTNPFDFNVTFVATNLTSAADLQDPNSALFNSAANVIVLQLNQLFSRSNVNGTFSSCRVLSFSSSAVQGTRVHANCTFRNDSDPQDVNRVRLYRVFRDLSNGITTLGPILLDSNSLYVNAISPIQTTTPNLQTNPFDFNVTFVATNLTSAADLQDPNSALFNSAANIIVLQLNQLFSRSNVNGTFSSCRVLSFSSSAVQGTRVHANCTFRNDSDPQDVNRVRLYRVFRDLSNGITTLGPILLDSNSLYVNAISPIQTTTPNLQTNPFDFNVTFVATNLTSAADLQDPNSALFNSAANIIVLQLNQLFSRSNVNGTFSSCRVLSFSSSAVQGTRVHANCTFRNDSDPQDVNRVRLYRVFRDLSNGITTLGPILLDSNSLYVNVEPPIVPETVKPDEVQRRPFNVTFNVLNLPFTPSLQNLSSPLYMIESANIINELNNLFANSGVNSTFSRCQSASFRPASDGSTTVEAICAFKILTSGQRVDEVQIYHEFQNNTEGITTLGSYSLDSNSLFVDGYHESSPTTTMPPPQTSNPFDFNVTFVMTNLASTASLQDPNSPLYESAASIIVFQLDNLFRKSNIKKSFSSCRVLSFSLANIQDTRVHANCTFRNDSDPQEVNRVTVYSVFRKNTKDITSFGVYTLDRNSLFVNDFHIETSIPSTTMPPPQTSNSFDFNVTFVMTNLASTASLQDPNSPLYESAASIIVFQLDNLFRKSNIKKSFSSCRVLSFSLANIQDTRVHANCTFRNDSDPQEVNRVTVYSVFRKNTKDITSFGVYTLDRNSLFVNDFHIETSIPSTTMPPPQTSNSFDFNVTFVMTNLASTASLQDPNSPLYESAASIIVFQLDNLFRKSNIKKSFSSCRVLSFSLANIQDTRVHANCTFRNDSDPQEVNRVTVYSVFRKNTKDITSFGVYTLDRNSLFVNDFHIETSIPSTTMPPPQTSNPFDFNVTFVMTNLASTASLQDPNSPLYESAASIIVFQLDNLFRKSNIKKSFSSCRVLSFSLANIQDTRVHANCTFRNDSDPQEVNRVTVYSVFRKNTKDITSFGVYTLDRNSLFVNDFHIETSIPSTTMAPIQTKNPFDFNVTFTVTNLALTERLQDPNSQLYKSAASIVAFQLDRLFDRSNVKKSFSGCKVLFLSRENIQDTRVHANCTFRNDSDPQKVNKVNVYRVFSVKTRGISALGEYLLDSNSLFVNDYHESTSTSTVAPIQTMKPFDFNVTFTVTNLAATSSLQDSNSPLYKSAASIVAFQMNTLFTTSNLNKTFSSCRVLSFSPENIQDTRVHANCTFRNDSDPQKVNHVNVYRLFRDKTGGISTLGAYLLDSNSLFVNGYNESTTPTTAPRAQPTQPFNFNVTFVITDLASTATLQNSNSALHKSAASVISLQLNKLFRSSKIKKSFFSCKVLSFSSANIQDTRVHANCTFRNDSNPQEVNRITAYGVFKGRTNGITSLGTYSLDSKSLYVNGYTEGSLPDTENPIEAVTVQPNEGSRRLNFNVTFTITNLKFNQNAPNTNTPNNIINLLQDLYRKSKLAEAFSNCNSIDFSPGVTEASRIEVICSFKNEPTIDKVAVYNEFRDNTAKITELGQYLLNENSLYVNGYQEVKPTVPGLVGREGDLSFELNFTIINRNFTEALNDPNSPAYKSLIANITTMLTALYQNSSLKDNYRFCTVTGLRIGSIKCTCMCFFDPTATNELVTPDKVKTEFATGTNGTNLLGNTFLLQKDSLSVEAEAPVSPAKTEIPFWGIIIIVVGILVILFLISLCCLLTLLYLKKKKGGSYDIMQNRAGLYISHLRFR